MKEIALKNGIVAMVDDEDHSALVGRKWFLQLGYAVCNEWRNGKRVHLKMHRMILGLELGDGIHGDHINGNRLDNQRKNLRRCTKAENNRNRPRQSNNTTGYKGVSRVSGTDKYRAQIKVNGKKVSLGRFDTAQEAYEKYCEAASQYHGEFIRQE